MFGIGGQELVLLMIIGLIVLGPERLPRIANQIGGWLGQARRMTRVMKRQLEEELDINKSPTIKPPPSSRTPSTKADTAPPEEPDYTLSRDDGSPTHDEEAPGTGVGDDVNDEADRVASEAERDAVEAAAENPLAPDDVIAADAEEKEPETS
ncbi:MAG: Sec-independent protein translocase protein TatB [Woeseiaceae bacterium]|nr:Sec-independent protein translocase protein TatB [Woeseiaceae bacterium]